MLRTVHFLGSGDRMAKKRSTADTIKREVNRLLWVIGLILFLGLAAFAAASYGIAVVGNGLSASEWLRDSLLTLTLLVATLLFTLLVGYDTVQRSARRINKALGQELQQLKAANNTARALQAMASTMRATLDHQQVVASALDVCSLALEEAGIPGRALAGAVFLYEDKALTPVAGRRFDEADLRRPIRGDRGLIAAALADAETRVTPTPADDEVLGTLTTMKECELAVCVPLRAGFQIFGVMVLGIKVKARLRREQIDLFNSVADQAIIALQNAQLYQSLEAEKRRIIEAEEEARKELARDLHDGPTQSVAAIVMRINFVSTLMRKDPRAAMDELKRIEQLAKDTSKEIRGMLFTLRPLVLDTEGLAAAIEKVMDRHRDNTGIAFELKGGDAGDLLNEKAQGVVFYIAEEALGNAAKHSEAELIQVRLWEEDGLFVARIEDDGKGFDVPSVTENYSSRGSLGMVNMRERAELIDGTLRMESEPGQGTAITLIVPLDKAGRQVTPNGLHA